MGEWDIFSPKRESMADLLIRFLNDYQRQLQANPEFLRREQMRLADKT